MSIAPTLLKAYPALNEAQRAIVGHSAGPLLVIAGPGSGKTFSLVLRTMNLLLLGKAAARQLVLCTFTEKAAFELRDRVSATARKIGYTGDLSELKVSTIHGLCNRLLTIHRHRTPLGNDYETLDELTQLLFIFEHFELIVGAPVNGRYFDRWSSRWGALADLAAYVDAGIVELGQRYGSSRPLAEALWGFVADIEALQEGQALDLRPADYFYRLLALAPFTSFITNENRARNLAILSQLLNTFQNYYHYTVVTYRNRVPLRFHLFNSFLRLLHSGGINEYEDPNQPFPKGYVQVMTIHQPKGLEFPVVVVGSLDVQISTARRVDRER